MNEFITKLSDYLSHSFIQYAFIVSVLIAVCSSVLGVPLVLKRFSFIGDGLSHVAFGALSIATTFSFMLRGIAYSANGREIKSETAAKLIELIADSNNMIIILPVTVIAAVLLLRTNQNAKIKGDAAVAMISVSALAIGYLLMNKFPSSSALSSDVCNTLFGSILTLQENDVMLCLILSVVVMAVFVFFYNRIFAVTFDETFSKATGIKTDHLNMLIAIITALVIVIAMKLIGSLLVSALIIFPALSSMRVYRSFRSVVICSMILSVFCSVAGIIASIFWSTPAGSTIVAVYLAAFLVFTFISFIMGRKKK